MRRMPTALKLLNNQKGVALMMATAVLVLIMYIAMEVSYDTNVEYIVNSNSMSRLKAYYAAKNGVEIALLRLKTYQMVINNPMVKQMGAQAAMLDQIWKFPWAWPVPIPDGLNGVDKDAIKTVLKESMMDTSYVVTIEDEGSKLDLNDLASTSKTLQDAARHRLQEIFDGKVQNDEEFRKKYANYRFEELINAIADWQTDKRASLNGGDKKSLYSGYPEKFPPNRGFRTVQEVRLVPGMTEDFFDLLEPNITVYGMKGINPNQATKEILKSLDKEITNEIADAIIKRRDSTELGGPFKTKDDFWGFVKEKGARVNEKSETVPLIFDKVTNFRIKSTGEYGGVSRQIEVVVMDLQSVASTIKTTTDKEKAAAQQNSGQQPGTGQQTSQNQAQSQTSTLPKGPPRIVYWGER